MKAVAPVLALALAGCTTLEPDYVRPAPAVPPSWPAGDAYVRQSEASLPAVTYQEIFRDPRLRGLIELGLANNRDLVAAAANIAAAREQYRVQRANLFPHVDAGATVSGQEATGEGESGADLDYRAGLAVTSFELDLFGRIRSLTKAELNRYFATEAAGRTVRLALVSDIANVWLTYAADASLLKIAEDTAASAERSVRLTRARLEGGIAPRTDVRQAEQILYAAQAQVAQQRMALAQDVNLLQLLVGSPIDLKLLPASIEQAAPTVVALPAGVSSHVLLRRPDVMEAEFRLLAANAEIGAARAAMFPNISLTGLLGLASSSLGGLLADGLNWTAAASASLPIFDAGANRANVRRTEAERDAAVALYQRAIQAAFREVGDSLARQGTAGDELRARQAQEESAADNYQLAEARYRAGIDDFLATLDAQRTYYSAQQSLVQIRLEAAANLVDLYRALGGDSLYPPESSSAVAGH
ncbi:MAG TPA: efflux transporter outer membrane subunit [Sphingomicrobium sp.]|nr:efflux transporter outer membrane subunit [Sphingomicrobium sp.]